MAEDIIFRFLKTQLLSAPHRVEGPLVIVNKHLAPETAVRVVHTVHK